MSTMHPDASWGPLAGSARDAALAVLLHGPISRGELAQRLDLTPGTVTRLTRPLIDGGLLVARGKRRTPAAGRPFEPLDIAADSRHFAGVKITATAVYAVVTDLRARPLGAATRAMGSTAPESVAELVAATVRAAAEAAGGPELAAAGVGLGGNVTGDPGHVYATFLGWADVAIAPMIAELLGVPTVATNDVAALVRAAQWFGMARDLDSFAMLTVGAGVGYGCVIHGEPVEPRVELARVSHLPIDPLGPLCDEGHRGCATALLAETSIRRQLSGALGRDVGYDEALDLAAAGQPAARAVISASARALGTLAGYAAVLTGCEHVMLSGEGVRIAEVAPDDVHAGIRSVLHGDADAIDLRIEHAPFEEWARGAAVRAIQTYVLGEGAHAPLG
ncbi:ROK family transcriptional regulator [Galbitalea sp. SE-J8]|uniref:ROK family transcriptional regulator n=1 Tax=Galbitalea sp. SE-J8 TaxID=3054952 RepID=UPI00259CBAFE|nr:ROK family transcriptional regulator [Galbitalea sp. SE-J8]MDM4764285.1 ROK family transcriptional regulator [Galbitalea sp. SE-J8]